jgi:Protein of unknown function (DUF2934)
MAGRKKVNNKVATPAAPSGDTREALDDAIRRRAFELYEERGKSEGHSTDDWLHAEAEVLAQRSH